MNYYRADEPRMPSSSRRYVDTRRPISRPESRIPQRAQRSQQPSYEEDYYEYDDEEESYTYENRPYVRTPTRHTPALQPAIRMPAQRPQRQTYQREEMYEDHPIQVPSRRQLFGKIFLFGGIALFGGLGINDYATNVKLSSDTAKYGDGSLPPTFYTTAVVGHNSDSDTNPSHFTVQNQNGHVLVFELPAGDPSKAVVYSGMVLMGANKDQASVSLNFTDVDGDGKIDMQIVVASQAMTYLNDGTKFVSPKNASPNVNQ